MDVIIAYLDTMFSPYPKTPRLVEAKAELQAMMEDAYQGLTAKGLSQNEAVGKVITDFGNLDELAPVLGITSELAPDAVLGVAPGSAPGALPGTSPTETRHTAPADAVTLDEAKGFAEAKRTTRFRTSGAIALFVLAPIPVVVLPSAAEAGVVPFTPSAAAIVGVMLLLVLVALAVFTLIGLSREFGPYQRLREGRFSRNPLVTSWAEELDQQHETGRVRGLQLAVLCWVLSPAPLILLSLIPSSAATSSSDTPMQGFWSVIGVAILLCMVALGLMILLPRTWARSVLETVTKTGGEGGDEDDASSLVGVIASFYWPGTTAIFLAWSFIGNAWGTSWIIWPIAGVLFGAIAGGVSTLGKYRKARR